LRVKAEGRRKNEREPDKHQGPIDREAGRLRMKHGLNERGMKKSKSKSQRIFGFAIGTVHVSGLLP